MAKNKETVCNVQKGVLSCFPFEDAHNNKTNNKYCLTLIFKCNVNAMCNTKFKRYININSNYKNRKSMNNLTHITTQTHFYIHLLV